MALKNGGDDFLCSYYSSIIESKLLRYKSFTYKDNQQDVKEGVYREHIMKCHMRHS
jgi:hypothetical protein